jgi:hypothetical protein
MNTQVKSNQSHDISCFLKTRGGLKVLKISEVFYVAYQLCTGNMTATCCRVDGWGSITSSSKKDFSTRHRTDRLWDSLVTYRIVLGALSQRIKWPGHNADHFRLTSDEVKLYLHFPIRHHGVMLN